MGKRAYGESHPCADLWEVLFGVSIVHTSLASVAVPALAPSVRTPVTRGRRPIGIAQAVQELGATLLVEHGQVVIRSHGPLPDGLQQEVRAHKAELLIALGVPMDQTVASILGDLRPFLPQSLQRLADDRLLALVNWSIMAAWGRALNEVHGDLSVSTQA